MTSVTTITISTYEEAQKKMEKNNRKAPTKPKSSKEVGQPMVFDIIIDISVSMDTLYDELVKSFNTIMIPALAKASESYKGGMRIGCLLFSDELIPAWEGFKTLDELGKEPLKRSALNHSGLRGWTALYGAMRAGVLWTAAGMEYLRKRGEGEVAKGKIIVLSDGANNRPPEREAAVANAFNEIPALERRNIQSLIGFFKTGGGLSESDFQVMAKKTGFEGLGYYDLTKGKTLKEKQAAFRHYFEIFSSRAAAR